MGQTISDILGKSSTTAVEHVDNGVLVVDVSGKVVIFNHTAAQITGYCREEVMGSRYDRLPFISSEACRRILEGGEPEPETAERVLSRKDGARVPVESRVLPVNDDGGGVVGVVEVLSDLTAINKLKDELDRSKTLSALGEMAANVAHEIRNPLGGIGGFAALLERDLDDDDPRRKLVKKIIEGVASLDKIVTNLLIYTRPVKPDMRWIDLTGYVDEVLSFVEVELDDMDPEIKVNRDFPPQPLGVRIDPSLMQQVLLNIFRNAVYSMKGAGGSLTISLSSDTDGSLAENEAGEEKEYINLLISDEGVGMSDEVLGKIFNPFFTTRDDGTGLGLAIAKKMILEQDGQIAFSSQVGIGTQVSIILPHYP